MAVPRAVRLALKAVAALVGIVVVYVSVTFAQVWLKSRDDDRHASQAILVFGAAQYDGRPSPVLKARLDHALELWRAGLADVIVVTGGRQPGDRFTEAGASAEYLLAQGVPDERIRREISGTNSWESLAAAARFLGEEGIHELLLVSDPYHSYRIGAIADELDLDAHVSPADTPLSLGAEFRALVRETAAVSVGRLIGYRRLMNLDRTVERVRDKR